MSIATAIPAPVRVTPSGSTGAVQRSAAPPTVGWRTRRLRTAAAAGGLAVLLTGSLSGHLPAASALTGTATSAVAASTTLAVTSVTTQVRAVARSAADR